jgi:hypothetical protein
MIAAMPERMRRAIEEWRQADERARGMEKLLTDAWALHVAGGGPVPNSEMVAQTKALRAEANAKLAAVTDAIEAEAKGLRR